MNGPARSMRGIFEKTRGSGTWWIRYTDAQGKYHREKAGTLSAAKKLLTLRRSAALEGRKLPELRKRPVLFAELCQDALAYSEKHKRSHAADESRMKLLKAMFGNRPADALSSQELESRLSEEASARKWAPSSFNHYRSLLMLIFREGRRAGKVSLNRARDVRHRREDNSRVRYLGREPNGEYDRLEKAVRRLYPEHLPELIFAVNTGLRLGSMYDSTYEMLDLTRSVLDIPRTKNEEPVHVPLNATALAALRLLPSWSERSGPIFRNLRHPGRAVRSNDHWFREAVAAAGIVNFRWHDIRHTFASWLVQDGVPLDRVSKLLGHKSLTMTMRYAHLAPNQLHEDVARLVSNSTPVAPEPVTENEAPAGYLN
jgi:integrase